jgi:hypothetical protein
VAGALTHFAANLSDAERQSFNAAFPHRLASSMCIRRSIRRKTGARTR